MLQERADVPEQFETCALPVRKETTRRVRSFNDGNEVTIFEVMRIKSSKHVNDPQIHAKVLGVL